MHDKIIHDFVRLTLSVRLNGPLAGKCAENVFELFVYVFICFDDNDSCFLSFRLRALVFEESLSAV